MWVSRCWLFLLFVCVCVGVMPTLEHRLISIPSMEQGQTTSHSEVIHVDLSEAGPFDLIVNVSGTVSPSYRVCMSRMLPLVHCEDGEDSIAFRCQGTTTCALDSPPVASRSGRWYISVTSVTSPLRDILALFSHYRCPAGHLVIAGGDQPCQPYTLVDTGGGRSVVANVHVFERGAPAGTRYLVGQFPDNSASFWRLSYADKQSASQAARLTLRSMAAPVVVGDSLLFDVEAGAGQSLTQPLPYGPQVVAVTVPSSPTSNVTITAVQRRCGGYPTEAGLSCADQVLTWSSDEAHSIAHTLFAGQPLFANISRSWSTSSNSTSNVTDAEQFSFGVIADPLPTVFASPYSYPRCYGDSGNCTGFALKFENAAQFVAVFLSYKGHDIGNTNWFVRVENLGYDPLDATVWAMAQCPCITAGSGVCHPSNHSCTCAPGLVGASCVTYHFQLQYAVTILLGVLLVAVITVGLVVRAYKKKSHSYKEIN